MLELRFKAEFKMIGSNQKPSMKELFKNALIEFKDLEIESAIRIANKNQTIKNSDSQSREFIVEINMNNQSMDFNMESPETDSKKGI
jgi:hypothetical protein